MLSILLSIYPQSVEDCSTPTARLSLLGDLLVLWANTSNFSRIRQYKAVTSDPIPVVARDLGMCVPRNKIILGLGLGLGKSEPSGRRFRERERELGVDAVTDEVGGGESMEVTTHTSTDIGSYTENSTNIAITVKDGDRDRDNKAKEEKREKSLAGSALCDPNEVVHIGRKAYPPSYTFDQLMSWFDAGTDELLHPPDIIGCVQVGA